MVKKTTFILNYQQINVYYVVNILKKNKNICNKYK